MKHLINRYRQLDPAARSDAEVLLLYPGVKALALHRMAHWLWGRRRYFAARAVSEFARCITGIEIHPGATIGRGLVIDHGAGVVIGETAVIGDDVLLFHGVTLGGTSIRHGKRHPTIGNGVVIGAGAKILGTVEVGDRAIIGANSVVTRDVKTGVTVSGSPAREHGEDRS